MSTSPETVVRPAQPVPPPLHPPTAPSMPSMPSTPSGPSAASGPSVPRARTRPLGRIVVDGVPFDALSEESLISLVLEDLDAGGGGLILTANVDIVRQMHDRDAGRVGRIARVTVADGQPVVWASRLQGTPLPTRVTGASLISTLSLAALGAGRRVMLLGGPPGTAERAARRLGAQLPGNPTVGSYYPPYGFDRDEAEIHRLAEAMRAYAPDVVFIGLGFPRQEFVAEWLMPAFPRTWFVGCGGAISMLAGDKPRAPQWMRTVGLEWVHRMRLEPSRLVRRYLVNDAPYALGMLARSWAGKARS